MQQEETAEAIGAILARWQGQNKTPGKYRQSAHGSVAKRSTAGFQTLRQIRESTFGTVENLWRRNGEITGLATGFVEMDRMTGGLQKGELTIIAAPPASPPHLSKPCCWSS
jgi:replicative DNA helicase